jgi:hypothetical protein
MRPNLSDFRGLPAFGCVAAYTRKLLFRYSQLCGTASDAVDAVRSETRRVSNCDIAFAVSVARCMQDARVTGTTYQFDNKTKIIIHITMS